MESDVLINHSAGGSRGNVAVFLENSVEIRDRGEPNRLGNFKNAVSGFQEHLLRFAYSYEIKIFRKGCSGRRFENTAEIALIKPKL